MTDLKDKILGSMIGGAVGDALGYTVEFMSYGQIIGKYGSEGITRYDLNDNGIAEISDDTQMSLYTANGLIIGDIKTAYLEWLQTQRSNNKFAIAPKCWISSIPDLYSQRAPGTTCITALENIAVGTEVKNNSKGCGGIMRVAPIALWSARHNTPFEESVEQAFAAAGMTHKHVMGWFPAGMLVYIIRKIIESGIKNTDEFVHILNDSSIVYDMASDLGAEDLDLFDRQTGKVIDMALYQKYTDVEAIRRIGEGWTGDEAWFISLYCTLKHIGSFEDAVVAAVNHSGDSDSTGAITGNIMGAIHGYDAIPDYYKTHLELRDVIEKMATDICLFNTLL